MRNTILVAISLVVSLSVAEIILRIPAVSDQVVPPAHLKKLHSAWGSQDYDEFASIKWRGQSFRSFHIDDGGPDSDNQILVLGDSYTWGDKIRKTSDTWPYVMEAYLRDKGSDIEVISLAHRGDTTVNQMEYFRNFGLELSPGTVIVQYLFNDPLPSRSNYEREGERWMRETVFPKGISDFSDEFIDSSYLLSTAYKHWAAYARELFDLRNWNYEQLHQDGFEHFEATKKAIAQFAEMCQAQNIRLIFIVYPLFKYRDFDRNYPLHALHLKMHRIFESNGIEYLDLLPTFITQNSNPRDWWALSFDSHPNKKAHRLAGETIASYLIGDFEPLLIDPEG